MHIFYKCLSNLVPRVSLLPVPWSAWRGEIKVPGNEAGVEVKAQCTNAEIAYEYSNNRNFFNEQNWASFSKIEDAPFKLKGVRLREILYISVQIEKE